jgi:hypothetical protein
MEPVPSAAIDMAVTKDAQDILAPPESVMAVSFDVAE